MGVLIGRLFGTDIRATSGFFLLMLFLFYRQGAAQVAEAGLFCLAIIVSLLVHEFGHVFAFRWQAKSGSSVVLWGLGGLCVPEAPTGDPRRRIIISLMGPAFEAVLGAVAVAVWFFAPPMNAYADLFVWMLVWINVIWLVLNLVPVLPLDGGQALQAALEIKLGRHKAEAAARKVSVACAVLLVVVALRFELWFLAVLGGLLALQNLSGRRAL